MTDDPLPLALRRNIEANRVRPFDTDADARELPAATVCPQCGAHRDNPYHLEPGCFLSHRDPGDEQ